MSESDPRSIDSTVGFLAAVAAVTCGVGSTGGGGSSEVTGGAGVWVALTDSMTTSFNGATMGADSLVGSQIVRDWPETARPMEREEESEKAGLSAKAESETCP